MPNKFYAYDKQFQIPINLFESLSAFSEFERSLISERTKAALARIGKTKKLGRPVGSKDKRKRKNDGYLLREYNKKIYRAKNSPSNK